MKKKLNPIKISKAQILKFATSLSYPLKPYQVNRCYEVVHSAGTTVFFDGGRQVTGKSHILIIACLILAISGRTIIYTAHRKDATRAMMNRFASLTKQLAASDLVLKESLSNGFEEIMFTSGGAIHFRARVDGTGVGLSPDVIVYDEAQMVSDRAISDLDPSVDASDFPMRVHIGTPPKPEEYALYPDAPFTTAMLSGDPRFIHHGPPDVWYTPDLVYSWEEHGSKIPTWKHAAKLKSELALAWAGVATETQREAFFRDKLSVWKQPEKWLSHEAAVDAASLKKMLTKQETKANRFYAGIGVLPNSTKAYIAANDGRQLMIAQEIDLSTGDLDAVVDWLRENLIRFKLIRIPGNERGKAIYQSLIDRGVNKARMKLVTLPELSTSISRFFKMTQQGEMKVFERDYVSIALSSFWLAFDQRSGSSYVQAEIKEDEALVLSLMQASVDFSLVTKIRSLNANAGETEPSESSVEKPYEAPIVKPKQVYSWG